MFKSLVVYRLTGELPASDRALTEALRRRRFSACAATQERSLGWAPPRGDDHDALIERVAGHSWLRMKIEQKILPASVVARHAEEKAARRDTKREVRRGKRDLRDEARLELLPRAFSRIDSRRIWIDHQRERVVIEAATSKLADEIAASMLATFEDIRLAPLATQRSPTAVMAGWLTHFDLPGQLALDRDCELIAMDETRAVVRYSRHHIESDEVRRHIQSGKMPREVGLTWAGRVAFVIDDAFRLKRIRYLAIEVGPETSDDEEERFDTAATLTVGELGPIIDELIAAHDGVIDR